MEKKLTQGEKRQQRQSKIPLPTTEKQVKEFAQRLCEEYGFINADRVLHSVCTTIAHFPRDVAYSTAQYFADCYNKTRAYEAAQVVGRSVAGDIQAKELRIAHQQDPTNQQIIDEIRALSKNGVKPVTELLHEIENSHVLPQN